MTDFKAKMHQIRFRLGLHPRPSWGSLQRSPRPVAGFGGRFGAGDGLGWEEEGKREGKGREGEVEGRKRQGPKLLLNQGPSEPCYATVLANKRNTADDKLNECYNEIQSNTQTQCSVATCVTNLPCLHSHLHCVSKKSM